MFFPVNRDLWGEQRSSVLSAITRCHCPSGLFKWQGNKTRVCWLLQEPLWRPNVYLRELLGGGLCYSLAFLFSIFCLLFIFIRRAAVQLDRLDCWAMTKRRWLSSFYPHPTSIWGERADLLCHLQALFLWCHSESHSKRKVRVCVCVTMSVLKLGLTAGSPSLPRVRGSVNPPVPSPSTSPPNVSFVCWNR